MAKPTHGSNWSGSWPTSYTPKQGFPYSTTCAGHHVRWMVYHIARDRVREPSRRPTGVRDPVVSAAVRYRELQQTLERLPIVEAVRVVESNGRVTEVHVLAAPGKPPKQVVRDVQSLAMAAFGITVDRRAISVVQIDGDRVSPAVRPSIEEITETPSGSRLEMQVRLSWHNELFVGTAIGPTSLETRPRLVGEATLKALETAIDGDVAFALANIDQVSVGPRTIILAVVVMVANGEERSLVGSALVATDPAQAAVRAVLDALNRQIPQLKR